MTKPTYLRVGAVPIVFVLSVIMGCGVRDDAGGEDVAPAKVAALSDAQVAAAKQVGLIPTGYLPLTLYDPVSDPGVLNLGDSTLSTSGMGINNSGIAVGYTGYTPYPLPSGAGEPFFTDGGGAHPLPVPWSGGMAYATGINDLGDILAYGYDGPPSNGGNLHAIVYQTNRSYQVLSLPIPPYYGYAPAPRFFRTNNTRGADGIPTLLGGGYIRAGTRAVWHLDGNANDAVGPTSFTPPAGQNWLLGGRTGAPGDQALTLDGSSCLSAGTGMDTWLEFSDDNQSAAGLTMMAWVRPSASMCPGGPRVVLSRDASYELALVCNADGSAGVASAISSGSPLNLSAPAGSVPFRPQWSHIAVTWDFHHIRTYVNGTKVAETVASGFYYPPTTANFGLGCQQGASSTNFIGDLDEVSVFQNGMGTDQIVQFANGRTNYPPQTVNGGFNRYSDGFYDIILQPTGGAYANTLGASDLGGVNDTGLFVGAAPLAAGGMTAVMYDPVAGWKNLNDFIPTNSGWNLQDARGVNNTNVVVGWGDHNGRHSAFRLDTTTGTIVDIGHKPEPPFDDPSLYIYAEAVNAQGHAVGAVYDQYPFWPLRATIYTDELGLTDLNALIDPASGWTLLEARAINDRDEVVGIAKNAAGNVRTFKLTLPPAIDSSPVAAAQTGVDESAFVTPLVDCVTPITGGGYLAVFGYTNNSSTNIKVAVDQSVVSVDGTVNSGAPAPVWFGATRHAVFTVPFTTSASWTLGHDVATASPGSTCANPRQGADGTMVDLPNGQSYVIDYQTGTSSVLDTERFIPGVTVGKTDGDFAVSEDGASTYRISLWTPQGRANLQPELALAYNSRSASGPLGMGWTIKGLSQISRCERTIGMDGASGSVTDTDADNLCLDGNRLIPDGLNIKHDGTEYHEAKTTFSQIIEHGDLSSLTSTFEVRKPNGMIFTYGGPTATTLPVNRNGNDPFSAVWSVPPGAAPLAWPIRSIQDRSGNTIVYTYTTWTSSGQRGWEHRLDRIDYVPSVTGQYTRSVVFAYEPRNTAVLNYVAGTAMELIDRIKTITMVGPNPSSSGPLRSYNFGYDTGPITRRDRLASVTECDGDMLAGAACKRPTRFYYSDGADATFHLPNVFATAPDTTRSVSRVVDLNGDGRDDIIYLVRTNYNLHDPGWRGGPQYSYDAHFACRMSNGSMLGDELDLSGTLPHYDQITEDPPFYAVDLDLDGRADVVTSPYPVDQGNWHDPDPTDICQFQSQPGTAIPTFAVQSATCESQHLSSRGHFRRYYGDLDGDGYPDQLQFGVESVNATTGSWTLRLGAASGFQQPLDQGGLGILNDEFPIFGQLISNEARAGSSLFLVDRFGDGVMVSLNGSRSTPTIRGVVDASNNCIGCLIDAKNLALVDLNGDSLTDIFYAQGSGSWLYQNQGNGFSNSYVAGHGIVPPNFQLGMDYDGDGRGDILIGGDDNADLMVNVSMPDPATPEFGPTGFGSTPLVLQTDNGGTIKSQWSEVLHIDGLSDAEQLIVDSIVLPSKHPAQLIDVNGDGLLDILVGQQTYIRTGTKPDLLTGVIDGLGHDLSVGYRPLSDTSPVAYPTVTTPFYAPNATSCAYPQYCVTRGLWAVSEVDIDDGISARNQDPNSCSTCARRGATTGYNRYYYAYEDGRTAFGGNGWLGFAKTHKFDPAHSTQVDTDFDLDTHVGFTYWRAFWPLEQRTYVTVQAHDGDVFGQTVDMLSEHIVDTPMRAIFPTGQTAQVIGVVPDQYVESDWQQKSGDILRGIREKSVTFDYDEFGYGAETSRVTQTNDGEFSTETTAYDFRPESWLIRLPNQVTQTSRPSGQQAMTRVTTRDYDASGRVFAETVQPDDPALYLRTEYGRNGYGEITSAVSKGAHGERRESDLFYDDDAVFPVAARDPSGAITQMAYHRGLGVETTQIDPNGLVDRIVYDRFAKPRGVLGSDGSVTSYAHLLSVDPFSAYTVRTSFDQALTEVTYDRDGRPVTTKTRMKDGQMSVATTSYDAFGNIISQSAPQRDGQSPDATTTYDYDNLNRLIRETKRARNLSTGNTDIRTTYKFYDGLTFTSLSPLDQTVDLGLIRARQVVVFDQLGRVMSSTDVDQAAEKTMTKFTYGPFGKIQTAYSGPVAGGGTGVAFQYDLRGRKIFEDDPDKGATYLSYNVFGELVYRRDANENEHRFVRDDLGRPIGEQMPSGQAWFVWDAAPNGIGRLAGAVAPDGLSAVSYAYDAAGRKGNETWFIGSTTYGVDFGYDFYGRLGHVTYPQVGGGRFAVDYAYDSLTNAVNSISDSENHTTYWQNEQMDSFGRVSQEKFGGVVDRTLTYDPMSNAIARLTAQSAGGATIQDLVVAYSPSGNLSQRVDNVTGIQEIFAYDALRRLRHWTSVSGNYDVGWEYDLLGNRTSRTLTRSDGSVDQQTFTYGENGAGAHALTGAPWGTYQYSPRGDQISGGGRTSTFTDYLLPDTITNQDGTTRFGYDAFRQRVLKVGPHGATTYVCDYYERRDAPSGVTHVFHVRTPDRAVVEVSTTGDDTSALARRTPSYVLDDHLQSTTVIADGSGVAVSRQRFDPFGSRIASTDSPEPAQAPASPITTGFTGAEEDDDLGVVNLRGRLYDPRIGRFLSPDPIISRPLFSQAYNRHSYVLNRPLNLRDPTGYDGDGGGGDGGDGGIATGDGLGDGFGDQMPGSTVGSNVGATDTVGNGADDGGNTPTTTAEDQIGAGGVDARVQDAGTAASNMKGADDDLGDPPPSNHRHFTEDQFEPAQVHVQLPRAPDGDPPPSIPGLVAGPHPEVNTPFTEGPGITMYPRQRDVNEQYGRPEVIDALHRAGEIWNEAHPGGPRLQVGAISHPGGTSFWPPHHSHTLGVDADIRVVRNDGREAPSQSPDRNGDGGLRSYSAALTGEAIEAVRQGAQDVGIQLGRVFFDDPALRAGIVRPDQHSDHVDHFHARFVVP
jgi:RHS repeat-associated protein